MDKEHFDYILKEINEHSGTPYQMANEEIADEMFPYIQMEFPNARIAKLGITQYIVVTTRAKNVLIRQMELREEKHLQEVTIIEQMLSDLKKEESTVIGVTMNS